MINQTNFKFMEKKILYHIGLYGFRKLIVYVIKDNGDNTSIVSLNKDGSFPKHVWKCNLHNINFIYKYSTAPDGFPAFL